MLWIDFRMRLFRDHPHRHRRPLFWYVPRLPDTYQYACVLLQEVCATVPPVPGRFQNYFTTFFSSCFFVFHISHLSHIATTKKNEHGVPINTYIVNFDWVYILSPRHGNVIALSQYWLRFTYSCQFSCEILHEFSHEYRAGVRPTNREFPSPVKKPDDEKSIVFRYTHCIFTRNRGFIASQRTKDPPNMFKTNGSEAKVYPENDDGGKSLSPRKKSTLVFENDALGKTRFKLAK